MGTVLHHSIVTLLGFFCPLNNSWLGADTRRSGQSIDIFVSCCLTIAERQSIWKTWGRLQAQTGPSPNHALPWGALSATPQAFLPKSTSDNYELQRRPVIAPILDTSRAAKALRIMQLIINYLVIPTEHPII